MKRYNVRPSKGSSMLAFFGGIGMAILGLGILGPIAVDGAWSVFLFMIVWMGVTIGITIYHGKNAFGAKGTAISYIEVADEGQLDASIPFDEKLRKLEALKNEGLLTQDEYEKKRKEILNQKW